MKATFQKDLWEMKFTRNELAPGCACEWKETPSNYLLLQFMCSCGCGQFHSIPVDKPNYSSVWGSDAWQWNGNLDSLTITPSISSWHGYLTNGEFVKC